MNLKRVLIVVLWSLSLAAPAMAEPSPEALLKARIVQLEAQLAQVSHQVTLLQAEVVKLQQPEVAKQIQAALADAEKAAGCKLDWSAVPPACLPEKVDDPQKAK